MIYADPEYDEDIVVLRKRIAVLRQRRVSARECVKEGRGFLWYRPLINDTTRDLEWLEGRLTIAVARKIMAELVTVPAAADMDQETFRLHCKARHGYRATYRTIDADRAWHQRRHHLASKGLLNEPKHIHRAGDYPLEVSDDELDVAALEAALVQVTVPAAEVMDSETFRLHCKLRHGMAATYATSSDRLTHDWLHQKADTLYEALGHIHDYGREAEWD